MGSWRYGKAQGNGLQNTFGEFREVKDLHLRFLSDALACKREHVVGICES